MLANLLFLLPDDVLRIGISCVSLHPPKRCSILAVHPMSLARHDVRLVHIAGRLDALQAVQLATLCSTEPGTVVSMVLLAAPNHIRQVQQVAQSHDTRMSGHHRCCGKVVRHARSHSPHAVAAGRVAHQENPVGVHALRADHALDKSLVKRVYLWFAPHIPGVPRSAWRHVHTLVGSVESFLVLPLLVVHLLRCAATAMQRNPERATSERRVAIHRIPQRHRRLAAAHLQLRSVARPHHICVLQPYTFPPRRNYFFTHTFCRLTAQPATKRTWHQKRRNGKKNYPILHKYFLTRYKYKKKSRIKQKETSFFLMCPLPCGL